MQSTPKSFKSELFKTRLQFLFCTYFLVKSEKSVRNQIFAHQWHLMVTHAHQYLQNEYVSFDSLSGSLTGFKMPLNFKGYAEKGRYLESVNEFQK